MTDAYGLFEHALLAQPRTEHGYCVDDVARGLIVTVRETPHSDVAPRLSRVYLDFLAQAQDTDGRMRNRRNSRGNLRVQVCKLRPKPSRRSIDLPNTETFGFA
jgi:hypothetical protein